MTTEEAIAFARHYFGGHEKYANYETIASGLSAFLAQRSAASAPAAPADGREASEDKGDWDTVTARKVLSAYDEIALAGPYNRHDMMCDALKKALPRQRPIGETRVLVEPLSDAERATVDNSRSYRKRYGEDINTASLVAIIDARFPSTPAPVAAKRTARQLAGLVRALIASGPNEAVTELAALDELASRLERLEAER